MEIKISGTPQEIKELLQVIASNKEQYESIQMSLSKKVDKKHVLEQINSSLEDFRIDGKKIHVTSDSLIDKNSIKDENIQNVSGEKVLASSLSVISTRLGEVTI